MGLFTDLAQDPSPRGRARVGASFYGKQSPSKDRLSWIIASRFAAIHSICLRKLTFTLLRVTSAFRSLRSLQPTQNPLRPVWIF